MKISLRKMVAKVTCVALLAACIPALSLVVRASEAKAESVVKSITADRTVHQEGFKHGSFLQDKQGNTYFRYYFSTNSRGDAPYYNYLVGDPDTVFTIKFNDGRQDVVGTAEQIAVKTGKTLKFAEKYDQENNPWQIGNTYDIMVYYLDGTGTVKLKIDDCPISNITFPSAVTVSWDSDWTGLMDWNDKTGELFYWYAIPDMHYKVTYKDGSIITAETENDLYEQTGYGVQFDTNQMNAHWYPGHSYKVDCYYAGIKRTLTVTIPESPVKKVELDVDELWLYESINTSLYESVDKYDDEGNYTTYQWLYYDCDEAIHGCTGKVTYKDGTTKNFTVSYNDPIGKYFMWGYATDQFFNHWKPGAHECLFFYKGYQFSKPVHVVGDVKNLKAEIKSSSASLTWNAFDGAASYKLSGAEYGEDLTYIKTLGGQQTSTSSTGLTAGKVYQFALGAFDKNNNLIGSSDIVTVVALAKPSLNSVSVAEKGISLSWSKVNGADGYNVYRSTSANGTYEFVKSVTGSESTVDTTVKAGQKYYYKVRAYTKYDKTFYSADSNSGSATYQKFTSFDVAPKSGVTMSLSWSKVSGASSYDVMWLDPYGDYQVVKSCGSSQTSCSHTGLKAGTRYRYKIIAKNSSGKTVAVSPVKEAVALATPTIQSVAVDYGLRVTWTKASGADRYNIYRSTSKNGTYEYIASVQGSLSYLDSDIDLGKTYYYKVRAYKKIDGKVYYGGYSNVGGKTFTEVKLTVTPKSGVTMSISWTSVSGAYSYDVTDAAGHVIKTCGSSQTSCSHTGLTAGDLYSYQIIARDKNGKMVGLSYAKSAVALATPTLNSATGTSSGVKLSWSKASGADRYNIYRSTSKNGTYEYVTSVQGTETYTDTSAKSGTTYYYKVRAYKKYDGMVFYGGYSNAVSGKRS